MSAGGGSSTILAEMDRTNDVNGCSLTGESINGIHFRGA